MTRFYALCFILLLPLPASLSAQIIRGRIVEQGRPVAGAEVSRAGAAFRSLTDQDGFFRVDARPGDRLVVRYRGEQYRLGATAEMVVDLAGLSVEKASETRSPAADTASGEVRTGAITRLTAEEFNGGNLYDPLQYIQGRAPGLVLARPGGDPMGEFGVRLRGLHTLQASDPRDPVNPWSPFPHEGLDLQRPLFVVDGLPGASLLTVDPASIASITVLRDAASAAAYGARGANGVILIETKAGEPGSPRLSFDSYLAMDRPAREPDVLSPAEFRRYAPPAADLGEETDWMDAITRTAWSHAHQLGFSGGAGASSYRLGLQYRKVQGIAPNSGFGQAGAQGRLQQDLWDDRLTLGANLAFARRDFEEVDPQAFFQSGTFNPTAPVYAAGADSVGGYFQQNQFQTYNPVAIVGQNLREGRRQTGTALLDGRLSVAEGLQINARYGFQREDRTYGRKDPVDAFYLGRTAGGQAYRAASRLDNRYAEIGAVLDRRLDDHHLQLNGGYSFQRFDLDRDDRLAQDFPSNDFSYDDVDGARQITADTFRARDELAAFFGSLRYDFRKTVFLTAGLRYETASRFGPQNKWGAFPSVAAGLAFHRLVGWNSRLYLRLGYGLAGQLPPKNYAAHTVLGSTYTMYYDGQFIPTYDVRRVANPNIGEERRREWSGGFDLGLWSDRLGLRFDLYDSRSSGLVLQTQLPVPPNVASAAYENIGEIGNRGWEAALNVQALEKNRFDWSFSLLAARNRTTIESFTDSRGNAALPPFTGSLGSPGACCVSPVRVGEGEPLGQFYGLVFQGIDGDGNWIYEGVDPGEYPTMDDEQVIGNGQPGLIFGWHNRLRYARFDLNLLLRGALGQEMVNTFRFFNGIPQRLQQRLGNVESGAVEGEIARAKGYPHFSSWAVENASFARLEYLTLGYDFPVGDKTGLSRLRLYLTAQNLFTLTGYSGPDPELRLYNLGNPLAPGIDGPNGSSERSYYFPVRTWLFGVNLAL